MPTVSRQQHHHHTNFRSQTLLKLSNIIPPSSTNLQINLIEPVLYFRGDTEESVGCFLRGNLVLNLSKPTKIRKIEMKFVGRMKTFWPEGKLYYGQNGNRNDLCEEQEIMTHNWTFVSPPTPSSETSLPLSRSNSCLNSRRLRILRTRSFAPSSGTLTASKFHLIPAGVHKYPFELFIPGNIPETIEAERGRVSYKLSAVATRSGLSPNLHVSQNVTIIRTVLEERNSEGIAIASEWNDQLGYEITIPKKAYPMGDSVDINLKLNPRSKNVKITGIKIQIDEKSVYKTKGQRNVVSRTLSIHKFDDFVKKKKLSDKNHSSINYDTTQEGSSTTNVYEDVGDLENLFYHENISFPIPKCTSPIHYSYKSSSINISHHLKFIFTIKFPLTNSNNSEDDKKKKKKVEIKVDVPIAILSCNCADDLPQYEDDDSPSYESPPSYEQSTSNRRRSQRYNSINDDNTITTITTVVTDLHPPPLERLLTV